MMVEPDALDVTLGDAELLVELDLTTEVMMAVQAFARSLTVGGVEELLQVRPQRDGAAPR